MYELSGEPGAYLRIGTITLQPDMYCRVSEMTTLFDHCKMWYTEQGIPFVKLPCDLKLKLYEIWVNYAFHGIGNEILGSA